MLFWTSSENRLLVVQFKLCCVQPYFFIVTQALWHSGTSRWNMPPVLAIWEILAMVLSGIFGVLDFLMVGFGVPLLHPQWSWYPEWRRIPGLLVPFICLIATRNCLPPHFTGASSHIYHWSWCFTLSWIYIFRPAEESKTLILNSVKVVFYPILNQIGLKEYLEAWVWHFTLSSRDLLAATLIACNTVVLRVYLFPISDSKKYILTIRCPHPQVILGDARFAPSSQETLQHQKFVSLQYRTELKRHKKIILASEGIEPLSPT